VGSEARERVAGALFRRLVVLRARRQGEPGGEGGAGAGGIAMGEVREAEFEVVLQLVGLEFHGALEVADGVGSRGVRQTAIDEPDNPARDGAELVYFVVPAAEQVVRPGIRRIKSEGALRVGAYQPGKGDLVAGVAVEGEFAVADGEGEDALRVGGIEVHGAATVVESALHRLFSAFAIGQVEGEIRILAGDATQDERVVGPETLRLLQQFQRPACVEPGLGGEGFAEQRVDGAGVGGAGRGSPEREAGAKAEHFRLLRPNQGFGCMVYCGDETCLRTDDSRGDRNRAVCG
jgi:hypothetical protein